MPLRALLLVTEQPQAGSSNHLKHNSNYDKHGSTLLSSISHGSASRPSSLRSIAGYFPNIPSNEPRRSTANRSTPQSSRGSLPQSDADPNPGTTRSSVHSPTLSLLQTTSGTDYAASSPPHSPPPIPGGVPSIRVPTPYMHLIRAPPEPEPPPELDEKGRPVLRLKTKFPAVGTALRYYKHASEDEDEDEDEKKDIPPGEMEERGETEEETRTQLKMDWKTNPRAKPGRRKDEESTKNPLYAPTRATPPVRFVREEDQFANWLNEDAFWAGKSIPKVEFGWWKRSAVEIVEILTKAELKREREEKAAAEADDRFHPNHKHARSFDENAPLPTARMTELTATHHRTPVACMSVGANWQFPIPVARLTHAQLTGLVTRGLLVVALPPGQHAADWGVETVSAVPTAGPWDERENRHAATTAARTQNERERESVGVPALAVVPPSPLLVSPPNSDAIKEGFNSLFSRAKNVREQFLKPTAHPTTTTSSPAPAPSSPPTVTTSTSDVSMTSMTTMSLSPSISSPPFVPSSPRVLYGSAEGRMSTDALSVRSFDTIASTSTASGGSRTSQWVSWASSKWGRS